MPTRGKFPNIGEDHVKRKCKARSETVAVESEGWDGGMEGGKISDSRYGDWLNSSNLKKNENLSKYFLQLETISLKLKNSNLQLHTFCCIIGHKKGKGSNGPVSNFLIKDIP